MVKQITINSAIKKYKTSYQRIRRLIEAGTVTSEKETTGRKRHFIDEKELSQALESESRKNNEGSSSRDLKDKKLSLEISMIEQKLAEGRRRIIEEEKGRILEQTIHLLNYLKAGIRKLRLTERQMKIWNRLVSEWKFQD